MRTPHALVFMNDLTDMHALLTIIEAKPNSTEMQKHQSGIWSIDERFCSMML